MPSIDVLVESRESKHDDQHFSFNIGIGTFCFSQRHTGECDADIGFQECSPKSSLRSNNLDESGFDVVSKPLIRGDGLLQV